MYYHSGRITLFLLLEALRSTNGETRAVFDLSYLPHLTPHAVAGNIQATLAEHSDVSSIELDLSYSQMGNTGIAEVMQSLSSATDASISFSARMNLLTPQGVNGIFQRLIIKQELNAGDEKSKASPALKMASLDLGWNNLHPDEAGSKEFLNGLRKLVESTHCPASLRFDCCGLGPGACRALGKGIMTRHESGIHTPISLHLCGNKDVGDAGIAALAAAIRGAILLNEESVVFEELDLSGCNVGDVGAEALALALETHPGCIKHLDLSNNNIGNDGATAIGRALSLGGKYGTKCLDMSNNPNLGNSGAAYLADALGRGMIENLIIRSCNVQADGAKAFGEMLKVLVAKNIVESIKIDLSGNPLGILRKVKKGQKYSASALKSKASATTASYFNFIGKKIKSGLKEVGLDGVADSFVNTSESDDEEEERMGSGESKDDVDPAKARCGAKAFASAIVVDEHELTESTESTSAITTPSLKCELGLRHCYFDEGAADALAATIIQARERFGIILSIDARMSSALEESLVDALSSGADSDSLDFMAERHMQALEVIRRSEQRAKEAAASARKRLAYEDEADEFASFDVGGEYNSDAENDDDF